MYCNSMAANPYTTIHVIGWNIQQSPWGLQTKDKNGGHLI